MKRDLAIRALKMAITFRQPPKGCIHHTNRGSQFCSHDYQELLRQHGFKVSMSGKGNCYDNTAVETFFKTIKAELIWRHPWERAEMAIFKYIKGFDNPRRRHSAPGWKSPVPLNGKWFKRALGAAQKRDRSNLRRMSQREMLAGMVGFEPTVHCTKICEKLLFFQSSVIQQVFGVFTGAFGVDQLFQRGFLIGGDNFNVG